MELTNYFLFWLLMLFVPSMVSAMQPEWEFYAGVRGAAGAEDPSLDLRGRVSIETTSEYDQPGYNLQMPLGDQAVVRRIWPVPAGSPSHSVQLSEILKRFKRVTVKTSSLKKNAEKEGEAEQSSKKEDKGKKGKKSNGGMKKGLFRMGSRKKADSKNGAVGSSEDGEKCEQLQTPKLNWAIESTVQIADIQGATPPVMMSWGKGWVVADQYKRTTNSPSANGLIGNTLSYLLADLVNYFTSQEKARSRSSSQVGSLTQSQLSDHASGAASGAGSYSPGGMQIERGVSVTPPAAATPSYSPQADISQGLNLIVQNIQHHIDVPGFLDPLLGLRCICQVDLLIDEDSNQFGWLVETPSEVEGQPATLEAFLPPMIQVSDGPLFLNYGAEFLQESQEAAEGIGDVEHDEFSAAVMASMEMNNGDQEEGLLQGVGTDGLTEQSVEFEPEAETMEITGEVEPGDSQPEETDQQETEPTIAGAFVMQMEEEAGETASLEDRIDNLSLEGQVGSSENSLPSDPEGEEVVDPAAAGEAAGGGNQQPVHHAYEQVDLPGMGGDGYVAVVSSQPGVSQSGYMAFESYHPLQNQQGSAQSAPSDSLHRMNVQPARTRRDPRLDYDEVKPGIRPFHPEGGRAPNQRQNYENVPPTTCKEEAGQGIQYQRREDDGHDDGASGSSGSRSANAGPYEYWMARLKSTSAESDNGGGGRGGTEGETQEKTLIIESQPISTVSKWTVVNGTVNSTTSPGCFPACLMLQLQPLVTQPFHTGVTPEGKAASLPISTH